jgi:hypothetical protein
MKTQGTQLYIVYTEGSTAEVVRIGCPTGISYSGAPADQIENTCLDETDAHTYEPGLKNPGTASVSVDFDTANTSHMYVYDQYKAGATAVTQWAVGFSDGTSAPTLDSDGLLQTTTDRSWVVFSGYVNDLPLDFSLNTLVKSDIPIQISGGVTVIAKSS